MARPEYKIGWHDFLTIRGQPVLPAPKLELDQRHGVGGTEITRVGTKGEPFSVVTERDYLSYGGAVSLGKIYLELIDDDPVELVIKDNSSLIHGYKVKVLNVVPLDIRTTGPQVGGLETDATGYGVFRWDLIATGVGA